MNHAQIMKNSPFNVKYKIIDLENGIN